MYNKFAFITLSLVLLFSCAPKKEEKVGDPLMAILNSDSPKIRRVMDYLNEHEVQIRYTQINRKGDQIYFDDFDFQVDSNNYFYPASTVKFPTAVVALEQLNQMDSLDLDTRFYVEGDSVETTFSEAISQIFAVSDNDANNRLIEFLGQDSINAILKRKGVSPVRTWQRLGNGEENTATKPLIVYENDSTTYMLPSTINTFPKALELTHIKKGTGFYQDDSLMVEPFDFSLKNYYPIEAQSSLLKRIIFPEKFDKNERFNLSDKQHHFLMTAMRTVPRNAGYNATDFYDGYCKFFIYGDTKENIPDHIEIYNKVGFAYGTLTDCAYIKDTINNVEFMITATVLVNSNGVFNDNTYEYDAIGIPFLAELGRQLYSFELNRKQ
ncbi:serine hydrolase [Zobellia sp. 1_MG-2023]|uniref:serine hydrolase n=1 Tax=Zobellia sp. 1_MG-2023 TaxID=3062626 RepID=UPI0026E1B333|nr:serine hydrolase [Zobellia sp. 1_MG-2023]MDO6821037.1 serine hydrolase [Zobellia sp. 1_MG-2023]